MKPRWEQYRRRRGTARSTALQELLAVDPQTGQWQVVERPARPWEWAALCAAYWLFGVIIGLLVAGYVLW